MTLTRVGVIPAMSCVIALAVASVVTISLPQATIQELTNTIAALTSVQASGRLVGSAGEVHAAAFLSKELASMGAQPAIGGNYLVTFAVTVQGSATTGHNVAGIIRATEPASTLVGSVLLGAHFDHLGVDGNGAIFPGADDNASGVAAVLAVSRRLATVTPRRRDLIVFLWSGEEVGCAGSRALISTIVQTLSPVAYVNLDMVGRNPEGVTVEGVGSGNLWSSVIASANAAPKLLLSLHPWFNLPTDVYTFANNGIPSLNLTTGKHPDYHATSDTPGKITHGGLARIADLVEAAVTELINGPSPVFQKPAGATGSCQ